MSLPKILTASGYEVGTRFFRGVDRRSAASGASLIWSIIIPADNENTLINRDLKSFEGGGIFYQVFVRGSTTVVGTYSDILIKQNSAARVQFQRVASWTQGNSVLADVDEIPEAGSGNNSSGGSAGGQAFRTQPNSTEFILVAQNLANASRTVTLALNWLEGHKHLFEDFYPT